MKTTTIYESEDSIIRVQPHEIEVKGKVLPGTLDAEGKPLEVPKDGDLAYITIYAGRANNFIHVNEAYIPVLRDILGGLINIYKLNKDNPTN